MRFNRQQRKTEDAQIDLTPMLDIVFILLIFFIVTSTSVYESSLDINRPFAKNAAQEKRIAVSVMITEQNHIYINNQRIDEKRVRVMIKKIKNENSATSLLIQADEKAFNGTIIKVIDAAKEVGIEQIALAAKSQ